MIDAHCHLQEFEDPGEVIAGLEAVICCGTGVESSRRAVGLAKKYKKVYAVVGVHPKEKEDRDKKELLKLLKMPKVVAVGECGLDYTEKTTDEEKEFQKKLLIFNIDLAKEARLPLVVHCRNAFDDVFDLLDRTGLHLVRSDDRPRNNPSVMMHCFTGNMEQIRKCVRRRWYVSFGGIITFKESVDLRGVVKRVPEDWLLIETDAPYLAPEPYRGQRNRPVNVKIVAEGLAKIRGSSINQIEKIMDRNCQILFNIPHPA